MHRSTAWLTSQQHEKNPTPQPGVEGDSGSGVVGLLQNHRRSETHPWPHRSTKSLDSSSSSWGKRLSLQLIQGVELTPHIKLSPLEDWIHTFKKMGHQKKNVHQQRDMEVEEEGGEKGGREEGREGGRQGGDNEPLKRINTLKCLSNSSGVNKRLKRGWGSRKQS